MKITKKETHVTQLEATGTDLDNKIATRITFTNNRIERNHLIHFHKTLMLPSMYTSCITHIEK